MPSHRELSFPNSPAGWKHWQRWHQRRPALTLSAQASLS